MSAVGARLVAAGVLMCFGCGAPGDPLPPLLNIPARTTGFYAVQRGDRVILNWTVPSTTTEGFPLKDLDRVVVLGMEVEGENVDPVAFESGARVIVELERPNPGETVERRLPFPASPGRRFAYAVKNLSRRGRSDGISNIVVLEIAAVAAAPANLRALMQPDAVRLVWAAAPGASGYQVYRRRGENGEFAEAATVNVAQFEDRDFQWKIPQSYFVRSIVKTGLGAAESADSPIASITPADTFPPSVPSGLQAVAGAGAVDLSWNLSPEPDTAGYNVYRDRVKLNPAPLGAPAFRDEKLERNRQYSYAVSAVDDKGYESAPSAPIQVMIP